MDPLEEFDPLDLVAGLIAEQATDESSDRIEPEAGIMTASAIGLDLDRLGSREIAGPRRRYRRWVRVSWKAIAPEGIEEWIHIRGLNPWGASDYREDLAELERCPVCHGAPIRDSTYCDRCDRCGADGKATFPGLRPDSAPRDDCSREYLRRPAYSAPRKGGRGFQIRRFA